MGECLSAPDTEKHTTTFETEQASLAVSGMQGWRKSMEDAHTLEYEINGDRTKLIAAVYDGHNTAKISRACGEGLPKTLQEQKEFASKQYAAALEKTFYELDRQCRENFAGEEGGCTACCVLIADGKVFCANAGDSRAVMWAGGKAVALSEDHKATDLTECERIEKAGGTIQRGRVGGTLAVARAIGDYDFKDPDKHPRDTIVTSRPDVSEHAMTKDVEFVVVACDGVWDMLSNEEVCAFVKKDIEATEGDLGLVCEHVMDQCLAPTAHGYGTDNMTIAIVRPKPAFFAKSDSSSEAKAE